MRTSIVVIMVVLATACGRAERAEVAEPTEFTIQVDKVERINGCHIRLIHAGGDYGLFAELRYACGVPSSALTEERWWGDKSEPPLFAMEDGDCLLLDTIFYCLEEVTFGKSASFKATYRKRRNSDLLESIQGT
jgi:hypothetical protein